MSRPGDISRLRCPHDGTPLLRGYGRLSDAGVLNRRRDCPRCGASYDTREEIVAVHTPPVAERGVPGKLAPTKELLQ